MAEKKDYNPGNPDEGAGVAMLERMNHAHQYLRELAFPLIPWREGMRILDVGCGGGETIHQMLGKSEGSVIDGVDYAKTSLKISSKVNAHELGKRVFLHRADVAKLPFDDDVFDLVTAMETTYFWPDILAAFSEIRRVLKKGGTFCGCFYIQGGCKRTDRFIKKLYVPKGFFTPPFETEDSLKGRLASMYEEVSVSSVEGMGCFRCRK